MNYVSPPLRKRIFSEAKSGSDFQLASHEVAIQVNILGCSGYADVRIIPVHGGSRRNRGWLINSNPLMQPGYSVEC